MTWLTWTSVQTTTRVIAASSCQLYNHIGFVCVHYVLPIHYLHVTV